MRAWARRLREETGTTLIETTIACGILLVSLAGLMSIGALATMHTENQGHLAPRTTEYAQDKMEQLLALAYGDSTSNSVVFPGTTFGGSGLANPPVTEPLYVGLAPGFVGLYQINVVIPAGAPKGTDISVYLSNDIVISNRASIAIQ